MMTRADKYFASCPNGLETTLDIELHKLGVATTQIKNGGVEFFADLTTLIMAILWSRTTSRIYKEISESKIESEKDLYTIFSQINWYMYLAADKTFKINTLLDSQTKNIFKNSVYLSQISKDAIVDHFRNTSGRRPSIELKNPNQTILLRIEQSEKINAKILIDLCGPPLSNRGYRTPGFEAPLRENLAAGIILNTSWTKDYPLIDPMCGSGTLLIEANLIGLEIAPSYLHAKNAIDTQNLDRWAVASQNWFTHTGGTEHMFQQIEKINGHTEIKLNEDEATIPIFGSDLSGKSLEICKQNLTQAGLLDIKLSKRDCLNIAPVAGFEKGFIITNPPYGERLGNNDTLATLYHDFGEHLKKNFRNYTAYIFTGNLEMRKKISLQTTKRIPLFNGAIDCRLLEYKLF